MSFYASLSWISPCVKLYFTFCVLKSSKIIGFQPIKTIEETKINRLVMHFGSSKLGARDSEPLFVPIFGRAVAMLFNWKYFSGWRCRCRWCADDVRLTWEWDFRGDFTGGQQMSSACRPHDVRRALHKAYWLTCFHFYAIFRRKWPK